jgi:DMSO/TMAO reductase YedYZ molybdopterin-dependent catalytic subunit
MVTRREVVMAAAAVAGSRMFAAGRAGAAPLDLSPELPEGTRAEATLDALSGKKPLIRLSSRPPNYETPVQFLGNSITANDVFFVRYHLADIPEVDANTWKIDVGGEAANGQVNLSLDDLKQLPAAELVAVCQCSGNRRGLFHPHVAGVEWGYGAMGCARWKGARLKDVLGKIGLKPEALEVVFDGADGPVLNKTPDFVKSLPVWRAMDDTTLVAYEMNGAPLPHWNGFPARIVVPGWTGTYWMKHVTSITVVAKPFDGFWMKSAYRIPVGKFPIVTRFVSQETATNTPITEMVVNSLITSPANGSVVKSHSAVTVEGVAWDGGYGIEAIQISEDGGQSWRLAKLGDDLGKYAFRPWTYRFSSPVVGKHTVMACAINRVGQTQTTELIQNPAGYHHNLIQSLTLNVV